MLLQLSVWFQQQEGSTGISWHPWELTSSPHFFKLLSQVGFAVGVSIPCPRVKGSSLLFSLAAPEAGLLSRSWCSLRTEQSPAASREEPGAFHCLLSMLSQ